MDESGVRDGAGFVTMAEYARHRKERGLPGGSRVAVLKAVSSGRITAHGTKKLIFVQQADQQWEKNTRFKIDNHEAAAAVDAVVYGGVATNSAKAVGRREVQAFCRQDDFDPDAGDGDLKHHRTREAAAKATLLEIEIQKEAKNLIRGDEARRGTVSAWRFLRDRLQTLGRHLAPKVAAVDDVREIQKLIDDQIREVLQPFADKVLQKILIEQGGSVAADAGGDERKI